MEYVFLESGGFLMVWWWWLVVVGVMMVGGDVRFSLKKPRNCPGLWRSFGAAAAQ